MSQLVENNNVQLVDASEEDTIDIKKIISRLINNWPLFAISVVVCLGAAIFYAKYSSPDWHVSSKILVEDQKNGPSAALGGSLNSDISSLFNVKSSADNEVQILKSRSLMTAVVKQMQLNVRTYNESGLKSVETFDDAPFSVVLFYKADTVLFRKYEVKIIDNYNYELTNSKDEVDVKGQFNIPVRLKQYDLTLKPSTKFKRSGTYAIAIESVDAAIDNFSQVFSAALSDKQSTTIDLAFSYPNPKKGEAILDTLMRQYLLSNLKNKQQTADSTMSFINKEINKVSGDLAGTENDLEQFKEQNNIADIAEQSKQTVTSATDYYNKLNQQSIQLTIINELQKILRDPNNKEQLPSALVLTTTDQSFGQSINAYNQLLREKEKATLSFTDAAPIIQNYNTQLNTARAEILKNLETYRNSLNTAKVQLEKQNSTFTGQLKQIPQKQRLYLDYQRKQQLKQELYLYLLQKREETAISKTSTISSSRIIDYAKSDFLPYKPKKSIIYLIGLIAGLVIPGIYLFIKELLNIRINNKGDIERITTSAIIGEISHNDEDKNLVVVNNARSVISEQFRSLRTNLQYAIDSSKPNVLLFTSSMSGEGKSFLSLNLGSALALTDKKVVFMELDLRKPKLSENIGLDNGNGFTNFIVSSSTDMTSIIKQTWFNENCYLISSGPIPPNPSELLVNAKLEVMINNLKKEFDYIIIDCAPIGLVTDALLLEKFADIVFYVVRQDYTYKSQLNIVNDLKFNKGVKNLYLLVNDIKAKSNGYSSYGQGYGYGYGYGEYALTKEKKGIKSLFKKNND